MGFGLPLGNNALLKGCLIPETSGQHSIDVGAACGIVCGSNRLGRKLNSRALEVTFVAGLPRALKRPMGAKRSSPLNHQADQESLTTPLPAQTPPRLKADSSLDDVDLRCPAPPKEKIERFSPSKGGALRSVDQQRSGPLATSFPAHCPTPRRWERLVVASAVDFGQFPLRPAFFSSSANFDFGQFRLRPISISANFFGC